MQWRISSSSQLCVPWHVILFGGVPWCMHRAPSLHPLRVIHDVSHDVSHPTVTFIPPTHPYSTPRAGDWHFLHRVLQLSAPQVPETDTYSGYRVHLSASCVPEFSDTRASASILSGLRTEYISQYFSCGNKFSTYNVNARHTRHCCCTPCCIGL